ncbi:hypothetical protein C8R46DRAFT_1192900 [Mycena filopes]|nr:hypothetical protein C8R46DRAFT_1192900 [Mycena filopes]
MRCQLFRLRIPAQLRLLGVPANLPMRRCFDAAWTADTGPQGGGGWRARGLEQDGRAGQAGRGWRGRCASAGGAGWARRGEMWWGGDATVEEGGGGIVAGGEEGPCHRAWSEPADEQHGDRRGLHLRRLIGCSRALPDVSSPVAGSARLPPVCIERSEALTTYQASTVASPSRSNPSIHPAAAAYRRHIRRVSRACETRGTRPFHGVWAERGGRRRAGERGAGVGLGTALTGPETTQTTTRWTRLDTIRAQRRLDTMTSGLGASTLPHHGTTDRHPFLRRVALRSLCPAYTYPHPHPRAPDQISQRTLSASTPQDERTRGKADAHVCLHFARRTKWLEETETPRMGWLTVRDGDGPEPDLLKSSLRNGILQSVIRPSLGDFGDSGGKVKNATGSNGNGQYPGEGIINRWNCEETGG